MDIISLIYFYRIYDINAHYQNVKIDSSGKWDIREG